jgi:predicted metal-dependent HD superfamily phosphohydrolase
MSLPTENDWAELWMRLGAAGNPQVVYGELVTRYSEKHRAFHNLNHIGECLTEFQAACGLAINNKAVELAIWLHDVIYDPRRHDNEEESATFAGNICLKAGLADGFALEVKRLILATKHTAAPRDNDAAIIVDVDLSILGQSSDKFDQYEKAIESEYSWVPKDAFFEGRAKVLKSFLERHSIYSTQYFREKYEAQARENLARSLDVLNLRARKC